MNESLRRLFVASIYVSAVILSVIFGSLPKIIELNEDCSKLLLALFVVVAV